MTFLFDVNVLLALHDKDHQSHDVVHQFIDGQPKLQWATCAITEAGFVRIASSPSYPGIDLTPEDAAAILASTTASLGQHVYWERVPSLLSREAFALDALEGHRQVTDTLLLGVCQLNKGTLVTLDNKIQTAAIKHAHAHLVTWL